jgi:hypothetical protein
MQLDGKGRLIDYISHHRYILEIDEDDEFDEVLCFDRVQKIDMDVKTLNYVVLQNHQFHIEEDN